MLNPALTGLFADMFDLKLSVVEKIARPVIVYVFLVICLRLFGKRQLAQLNPFDLVVLLSISNTVQNAIIGDDNTLVGGLIGALALFGMNYVVVRFVFRHRSLDQMLEGTPTVLIEGGRIRREALAKELLSEPELEIVAHRQGFTGLHEVDRCVLEPGGVFYMHRRDGGPGPVPAQVLAKLDRIEHQLEEIRSRLPAR